MAKRNIVHIEIPSRDVEEAGKFYHDLFGWIITPIPEMSYTTWEPEIPPGGGFNPLGEQVQVGEVLIYVDSTDIEADLQRVKSLGGKVVAAKSEIPGVGWYGIFQDPTGNKIALYTSMDKDFNE